MRFAGKVALVTGASSGIGAACCRRLARLGCRLILTARSQASLDALAEELPPAESLAIPADLTDAAQIAGLCSQALDRFGRVDLVVNNAGVGLYSPGFASEPEHVRRLFELNVFAPVELVRLLLPAMPAGGAVVNVSSIGGKVPLPWQNLYSASKYALNAYSDALRIELEGSGIQVLCVCPGYVDTPFRDNALEGSMPAGVQARRERFMISAERCADEIVEGLRKGKRTLVVPRSGWLLAAAARVFPRLTYRALGRMNTDGRLIARRRAE